MRIFKHLAAGLLLSASLALPLSSLASTTYHGNVQSHVYHNKSCQHFNAKQATAVFHSQKEAEAAGYKKCKLCFETKPKQNNKIHDVFQPRKSQGSEKMDSIFN